MATLLVGFSPTVTMIARPASSFHVQCKRSLVALPIMKKRKYWSSLQAQEQSQAPINVRVAEEKDEYEDTAQQPENGTLKSVKDDEDSTSTSQNSELTATTMTKEVMNSIKLLKNAAKTRKVVTSEVVSALRVVKNAKLNAQNFLNTLGGNESPGRTWMLIFTAQGRSGKGFYFPVTAVQRFDASAMRIENGIYLGPIGCLAFEEIAVAQGRGGGTALWCRCTRVT